MYIVHGQSILSMHLLYKICISFKNLKLSTVLKNTKNDASWIETFFYTRSSKQLIKKICAILDRWLFSHCRNQRTWKLVDCKIYNDLTSGKSIQSQSTTTEGSCGLIYHELRSYRFCNPPTFRSFDTHSCMVY